MQCDALELTASWIKCVVLHGDWKITMDTNDKTHCHRQYRRHRRRQLINKIITKESCSL